MCARLLLLCFVLFVSNAWSAEKAITIPTMYREYFGRADKFRDQKLAELEKQRVNLSVDAKGANSQIRPVLQRQLSNLEDEIDLWKKHFAGAYVSDRPIEGEFGMLPTSIVTAIVDSKTAIVAYRDIKEKFRGVDPDVGSEEKRRAVMQQYNAAALYFDQLAILHPVDARSFKVDQILFPETIWEIVAIDDKDTPISKSKILNGYETKLYGNPRSPKFVLSPLKKGEVEKNRKLWIESKRQEAKRLKDIEKAEKAEQQSKEETPAKAE